MDRLSELQAQKRNIEAEIDEECRRLTQEAHDRAIARPSKWDSLTEAQKNWCHLMAFDPDNPDVPLD